MTTVIVLLLLLGTILLGIEVFVPGGILGILGMICILTAIGLSYFHHESYGPIALAGTLIVAIFSFVWWYGCKQLTTTLDLSKSKTASSLHSLNGKTGVSTSPLRPTGVALFENQRIDVVAESGLIEQQTPIQIIKVEGNIVVVRKI